MPATTTPFPRAHGLLELVLPQWRALLQGWAVDGSISRAAHLASRLDGDPSVLKGVVGAWEGGNFSGLPPIELLPAESIPGAAGAYAFSTGTIYLNADWLATATPEQVVAVLTEELGHHLDGLLNAVDTPGDEGELFAALLQGNGVIGAQKLQRLLTENDHGSVEANGQVLEVEQATVTSTPIRVAFPGRTNGEFRNGGAFAALRGDGSVVTWGGGNDGGDSSSVAARLASGVSQIFSNPSAFAALKADGSVVTWGYQSPFSNISPDATRLSSGVIQISSTEVAFAALKANGSVVTWGSPNFGGDSSAVAARLASGVTQIFSHGDAFAALKGDGSVVTWGNPSGFFTISPNVSALASGVIKIFSTYSAFAALKADGSVSTWGGDGSGGDSRAVAARLTSGVTDIFSCFGAFAALKSDGSVVTWGDPSRGGNSSAVADRLASGVTQIFSTRDAFAALKGDGSVVTWGDPSMGGNSSAVAPRLASGVTQIFSTGQAFAALKDDGSVVTWGNSSWGGNSGAVADRLASGVTRIFSSTGAFAALKGDGSVVTWGDVSYGGDSSAVAARLASGVTQIFANSSAFAALKADGTVVTWGSAASGGDSSAVANKLTNVVGFANPFTDDRLVAFDSTSPLVTLAVSSASVAEDGATNLVFTFSRTGSTTNSLLVNYTVGGSARLVATPSEPADYTFVGVSSPATTRTIIIAAGSATATVTMNPTADSDDEPNETVALTLTAGTGYTIGTSDAVVGTITNDDLPSDDFAANTSTTGSIAVGASRTGTVNFNGDRDWFRLSLTAGRTYRFNLNGNSLVDPTLALLDASGSRLSFNDDFNSTRNSQITFTASTSGTYFLDAGAFDSFTGSYLLQTADTTPVDDFAANTSTTGSIAAGASRTGVVNFDSDRDWFRLSLTAGRTYRFNLNGTSLTDSTLALLDASGSRLSFNDDFNSTRDSQITFTASTSGTYFLDAGGFGTRTGSYLLQAADITSPTPTPPPSDPTTPWITALAGVNWSTVTSAALLGALPKSATNQFSISLPRLSQPSSYTLVFTGQNMQIKNIFNPSASSSWGGTVSKLELKQGATVVASAAIRSTALSEIAQKILADLGDASPGLGRPTVEFLQQRLNGSLPSFAIAPLAANRGEGYSGPTPFTFTVSRLGSSAAAGSVRWRAAGSGSKPTDGADFSGATSGTLSFAAGQSSRILTINAAGDLRQENDETFSVTLSSPTGGILGSTAVAAATIRNDDFMGDGNPNTLRGGNLPDWIDGRAGADTLSGGAAGDRFGFSFGHSSIPAPDRITDFQIGVDKIDLITASGGALPPPTALTRAANNSTAPTLSALAVSVFLDANGAVAGNQPLAANRAALVVATNPVIAGTYLFINDGNAARSNSNDLLINISGHSGALPGLGVIPVGSFFL